MAGTAAEESVVVPRDKLARADPDTLTFSRSVKIVKSDTFVTSVSEHVEAPTLEAARAALEVPVETMVSLAADPRLVIPEPAEDPVSGCPGYVKPGSGVFCTSP